MKILTLSLTLGLGLALFGPSSVCPATKQGDLVQLRVSVFNSSPISPHALEQAEDKASRILRDGSVEVIWLNCPQDTLQEASFGRCSEVSFPAHLHLRIARSSRGLKPSTVGMSFLDAAGKGCYADLFYEPVQQLNEESNVAPSVVLGHAMAHELGHLLLGTNSHSPSGLMRAHWDREDLINASKGNLLFSREQSLKIRLTLEEPRKLETMEMSAELAGRGKSQIGELEKLSAGCLFAGPTTIERFLVHAP